MKYLLALSFLLAIPAFSEEPKKEAAVVVAVPSPTPSIVQEMINEPATEPALDPVFVPPTWLQEVVLFIKNIPMVGPVLVEVGKWAGFLASVLTAFVIFLWSVIQALQPLTKISFIGPHLVRIIGFITTIMPYVQYLSMFNSKLEKKN